MRPFTKSSFQIMKIDYNWSTTKIVKGYFLVKYKSAMKKFSSFIVTVLFYSGRGKVWIKKFICTKCLFKGAELSLLFYFLWFDVSLKQMYGHVNNLFESN